MADETTRRVVETRFTAKDDGHGRIVSELAKGWEEVHKKVDGMKARFAEFRRESGLNTVALLGVGVGLGSIIEKMKQSQAEYHQTQNSLAGVLSAALKFEKGSSEIDRFNRSMVLSKDITRDLDNLSSRFVVGLTDVAATYRTVAVSAGSLGLTQKQVMSLTEEAVATAKRFGVDGSSAAESIARALQTGVVRGFDPFNIRLRQALGNMKHLSAAQRFDHIEKALKGSVQIADQMGKGMGGSLARIQSVVSELLRDLSTPLFREISTALEHWAQHLHEASESGRPLIEVYANRLVDAFHTAERISAMIFAHWKEIAVVWAGFKGAQFGAGLGKKASGLGIGSKIGGGLTGGGLVGGLSAVAGLYVEDYAQRKILSEGKEGELGQYRDVMQQARRLRELQRGPQSELMDMRSGEMKPEYARAVSDFGAALRERGMEKGDFGQISQISAMARTWGEEASKAFGMPADEARSLAGSLSHLIGSVRDEMPDDLAWLKRPDKELPFAKNVQNFYGGINVQMKIEESDPDRVFIRFKQGLDEMTDKRSQAIGAEPQGM